MKGVDSFDIVDPFKGVYPLKVDHFKGVDPVKGVPKG